MIVLTTSKARRGGTEYRVPPPPPRVTEVQICSVQKSRRDHFVFVSPKKRARVSDKNSNKEPCRTLVYITRNAGRECVWGQLYCQHLVRPSSLTHSTYRILSSFIFSRKNLANTMFVCRYLDRVGLLVSLPLSRFALFANWRPTPAELWATEMRRWLAVPNRARSPS